MRKLSLWLSLCLLSALCAGCGETGDPESVAVGGRAPNFSLQARDGSTVKSSSLKGEVVVLNFWATYCGPCRSEIPELNEFAARSGAKVIGISLDESGPQAVRRYEQSQNLKLNYTVVFADEDVFQRFNGVGIPYTLVLDREQRIVNIYRGTVTREALESDLAKINHGA